MQLTAQKRELFGKKTAAMRREGLIPAELYGHNVPNFHLAISQREFLSVFKEAGMNTVIDLQIGKDKKPVVIHEVQRDYLKGDVTHIDFYQVSLTELMHARVPLEFIGEAPAVKEKGGILNKAVSEIEVEALPADLPHRFTVDVSGLDDVNKSLYVRDLDIPKAVRVLVEPETVIVTVTPPRAEEVVETPVDVSAVKVETEEKKAKREVEEPPHEEAK